MVERDKLGRAISHLVLVLGVIVVAFPVYVTFIASTQTSEQIVQQAPMSMAPGGHMLETYRIALFGGTTSYGSKVAPVAPMLWVSLVSAVSIALGKIAISLLSAFAFVYFRFPGRSLCFWMVFITLMLPVEVRIGPTYEVVSNLGMLNSFAGLTVPLIASATATFLFRQFFLTVPDELVEAERTPLPAAMAVSAMSQMWMFAVYEFFRTWRQRVQLLLRIHDRVQALPAGKRGAALEHEASRIQSTREEGNIALSMIRSSITDLANEQFAKRLRQAFDKIEPTYRQVEALRITLAKHEIPKSKGLVAFAPGYGRIDYHTGSIYWHIDLKDNVVDVVNRRGVADDLKRLRFEPAR